MSTTSTSNLPANFVDLDGTLLHLGAQQLHTIPASSKITVHLPDADEPVTYNLNGMTANDIDATIRDIPKLHGDKSPAVPGRMRNLMKSAVEDGWFVSADVRPKRVVVTFHQPSRFVMEALRDLVATIDPNRARNHVGAYMVKGYVSYDWDYDADAMRVDAIHDYRLGVSREQAGKDEAAGLTYRSVTFSRQQSSQDEDKFTWREFVSQVHDQCPPLTQMAIERARLNRAAKAATEAAWDNEAALPTREALRVSLRELRREAVARIDQVEALPMPALNGSAVDEVARRVLSHRADNELVDVIDRIFIREGEWHGANRRHIEAVLIERLTEITNQIARSAALTTTQQASTFRDLHVLAHVAQHLGTLAKVTTVVEVVV